MKLSGLRAFDFGVPFHLRGFDVERHLRGFKSIRYIRFCVPRTIPAGRVLVHNHVQREVDTPSGLRGFRAWTQKRSNKLVLCECGWAGLPHYRVKGLGALAKARSKRTRKAKGRKRSTMKVYHRTFYSAAILREGFRDSTDTYMTTREHTGVWVSDCPLDENEGADGDVLLTLSVPIDVFAQYEWLEEGKPYRESLIPAAILNTLAAPTVMKD